MPNVCNFVSDIIEYIYCKQFNDLRKEVFK